MAKAGAVVEERRGEMRGVENTNSKHTKERAKHLLEVVSGFREVGFFPDLAKH